MEAPRGAPDHYGRPKVASTSHGNRSFAGLAANVVEDVTALVRAEIQLAKAEVKESATHATKGLALLAGAAALGLATVIMSLVALVAILAAIGLPVWIAAIVTTLIAAIGAAGLAWEGAKRLRAKEFVPKQTLAQLSRDWLAIKEQVE